MRTPALALLWESWRLSRLHLVGVVFLATFCGAAMIVSPVDAAESAVWALLFAGFTAWISPAWAGNVDARKGFSLALGFARPIPTWVLVGVPMAYVGVTCALTYLVPVLTLQALFGIAFPLLPVAASLATLSLVQLATTWGTPKSAVRFVVPGLVVLALRWYSGHRTAGTSELAPDRWRGLFAYSAWAYVGMLLTSASAFAMTIAGVARQRRGDDELALVLPAKWRRDARPISALRSWLADRLRLPCPISSPTRAQLWLEVHTVGARVLTTGILFALAAPVALTGGFWAMEQGLVVLMFYGFLVPLIVGFRRVLGVRRKQGTSDLGAFTATRAMGTGPLIGLKVLVTSVAVLGAWAAIGTSLWFFAERLAVWGPEGQAVFVDYWSEFVPSLQPTAASLSTIASLLVYLTAAVAAAGAFHALLLLNKKRVVLAVLGLALYVTLWVVVGVRGWVDAAGIATSHLWFVTGAVFLGVITLFRHALAERIITRRGFISVAALSVLALWAGFTALTHSGQNFDAPYIDEVVALVLLALVPIATVGLAPWLFSRIRHQ